MEPRRKILCILLVLVLIPVAGAAPLVVSIGDVTAAPGSTVTVPVSVTGAQDLGSLDLAIAYDPAVLSILSVDRSSPGNGLFGSNTDRPGIITVSIADPDGISTDGSVAALKFRVTGAAGNSSPLALYNILAADVKTFREIPADGTDGSVTVKKTGIGSPGPGLPALLGTLVLAALLGKRRKP